jgi:hypothetical protein
MHTLLDYRPQSRVHPNRTPAGYVSRPSKVICSLKVGVMNYFLFETKEWPGPHGDGMHAVLADSEEHARHRTIYGTYVMCVDRLLYCGGFDETVKEAKGNVRDRHKPRFYPLFGLHEMVLDAKRS